MLSLKVQCYSGARANEKPVSFILGEKQFVINDIVDRWYGPDYLYFKVRADDGNSYILRYDERHDQWELEMFQKKGDSQ
jgi:hypothetical protein